MRAGIAAVAVALMLLLGAAMVMSGGTGGEAARQYACPPGGIVGGGSGATRTPLVGVVVASSEYGWRSFGGRGAEMHWGLDLATPGGADPVLAARAGTVSFAGPAGSAGNMVKIEHGDAVQTVYMHMRSLLVSAGQQVSEGQQIGVEGNTGDSEGAHLHLEVHVNGAKIAPRPWLLAGGAAIPAPGESLVVAASSTTPPSTASTATSGSPSTGAGPGAVGRWTPEQVRTADTIVKVGKARGLDEWAITLGVAVGIGESSLRNVEHGDAVRDDTIGVFQIGPEHGTHEQRMDPTWAAGNFYTRLTQVPGYRDLEPTLAAHQAQDSSDPYGYARHWAGAGELVATITGDAELLELLPGMSELCVPGQTNAELATATAGASDTP